MRVEDSPYCGLPPAPADLVGAWNTDWRLWLVLAALAVALRWAPSRRCHALGWLALVVAFASPLCALTVSLFAARSLHHVWLLVVVAPLLGAAWPRWGERVPSYLLLLATLTALVLWHVPVVYALAWQSHVVYALLQLALLVPAVMWWSHMLAGMRGPQASTHAITALSHLAVLAGVMGLIGAVLTFAPEVLYPEHGLAMLAYGLQPLQDQQLAGLLMWVPGFVPLAVAAGGVLYRVLRSPVDEAPLIEGAAP